MDVKDKEEIITYRGCIKDGLLIAFIIHTIIGQIIFSSGPIFALFLIITIITGLIFYTPIVMAIRNKMVI
jgi:hypothetical protein